MILSLPPRRWFTSDNHFDHVNVLMYCNRPFESVQQMNLEMVRRWNAVVAPTDEVWHLGDFTMNFPSACNFFPLLNGRIHLVPGNHDKCHAAAQRGRKEKLEHMREEYLRLGFRSVEQNQTLQIGKHTVQLNHMPYRFAGDPNARPGQIERYTEFRPVDRGRWLIHGHVHQHWKTKGRCINVGVDVWDFTPVSEEQILQILDSRED